MASSNEQTSRCSALSELGQSVWIDSLSRASISGGHLQSLIDEYAVVGATSNPTIFQKAMSEGDAYDEQLRELADRDPSDAFWALAVRDIKDACDVFRPVCDASAGRDGYVSLEVDPTLAYETLQTFREAIDLHETVDRPNLLVKIPATKPGLAAIEDVIANGRSINVTLIFSLRRYAEVAESYVRGHRAPRRRRRRSRARWRRWRASSSRASTPRPTGAWMRSAGTTSSRASWRVANARLAYEHYQDGVRRPALGVPGRQGRHAPAGAVGVDLDQEPGLPGHAVRGGADRAGHRQHDARGDDRGLPGPRRPASRAWSRTSSEAHALLDELAAAGVDYEDVTDTLRARGRREILRLLRRAAGRLRDKQPARSPGVSNAGA